MAYVNKAQTMYTMKGNKGAVIARNKNEACYLFSVALGRVVKRNEVERKGYAGVFERFFLKEETGNTHGLYVR